MAKRTGRSRVSTSTHESQAATGGSSGPQAARPEPGVARADLLTAGMSAPTGGSSGSNGAEPTVGRSTEGPLEAQGGPAGRSLSQSSSETRAATSISNALKSQSQTTSAVVGNSRDDAHGGESGSVSASAGATGITIEASNGGATAEMSPTNAGVSYAGKVGEVDVSAEADRGGGTASASYGGATAEVSPTNAGVEYEGKVGSAQLTFEADRSGGSVGVTDDEGHGVEATQTGVQVDTGNDAVDTFVNLHTDPIGTVAGWFGDDETTYTTSDGQTFDTKAEAEAHQKFLDGLAAMSDQVNEDLGSLDLGSWFEDQAEAGSNMMDAVDEAMNEPAGIPAAEALTLDTMRPVARSAAGVPGVGSAVPSTTDRPPSGADEARASAAASELGLSELSTERIGNGIAGLPGIGGSAPGGAHPTASIGLSPDLRPAAPSDLGASSGLPSRNAPLDQATPSSGWAGADPTIASGGGPTSGLAYLKEQVDQESTNQKLGIESGMDLAAVGEQAASDPSLTPAQRAEIKQQTGATPSEGEQAAADAAAEASNKHAAEEDRLQDTAIDVESVTPVEDEAPDDGTATATPNPDDPGPVNAELAAWAAIAIRPDPRESASVRPADPGPEGATTSTARPLPPRELQAPGSRLEPYVNPEPDDGGIAVPAGQPEVPAAIGGLPDPGGDEFGTGPGHETPGETEPGGDNDAGTLPSG